MRVFLTVNMKQEIKNEIEDMLPSIRSMYDTGRWVPKDNWHVTMLFLGDIEDKQLDTVEKVMEKAVNGIEPFELWLEGVGAFPSNKKANILWAGVKGELEALQNLYEQTLQEMKQTDLPYDAKPRFSPHLTLARKLHVPLKEEGYLKTSAWTVDALILYQSIFENGKVRYQQVLSKSLGSEE